MNPAAKAKKPYKSADRVSLTPLNVQRMDKWLSQVQMTLPDLKLNKTDLINWMLRSRTETLSERELAEIHREYFDPVKALEAAIAQAKKRQGLGEEFDIRTLVNEKLMLKKRRSSKRKSRNDTREPATLSAATVALD